MFAGVVSCGGCGPAASPGLAHVLPVHLFKKIVAVGNIYLFFEERTMREDLVMWFMAGVGLDWAAFLIRWAIALALLPYGIAKFSNPQRADKFFHILFLSPKVAYFMSATVETFVPLCLLAGLFTRFAALAGMVNMFIASTRSWKSDFTSPALVFLLGMFAIFCIGPGAISVDHLFLGH